MQSWLDTLANITIVCTLVIYALQLRSMNRALSASFQQVAFMQMQLDQTRRGNELESLLEIIRYLQAPDARADRRVVYELEGKPFNQWSQEEIDTAERVCHVYNTAALLIREGLLPEEPIVLNWGRGIRKCHDLTLPLLTHYRADRGDAFWSDFTWLASKVPVHPRFGDRS